MWILTDEDVLVNSEHLSQIMIHENILSKDHTAEYIVLGFVVNDPEGVFLGTYKTKETAEKAFRELIGALSVGSVNNISLYSMTREKEETK